MAGSLPFLERERDGVKIAPGCRFPGPTLGQGQPQYLLVKGDRDRTLEC